MARPKASKFDSSDLSMLSLEDFLHEEVQPPSCDGSPILFQPQSFRWDRGRWRSDYKNGLRKNDEGGRGRGGRPLRHPRKEGVKPGVMMTHDPPPRQPLAQRSLNSGSRPMESILTVGSHELKSVKENARAHVNGEAEIDLEAVLTNAVSEREITFVLNQKLTVEEAGQKCHFLPVQDLNEVKRNTILKLLVGFLNAGERGVIYMGILEDGRVEGISAEQQLISQFVEGLMKTVQFYLMPRLHMPQYGVRYTNVLTTSGQILNNLWIVELHAVPQMQHYYNLVMDMTYFVRHGKETKSLPFKDFCDMVVAESSRSFEPEIQRMEERVRRLREELEAQGIDTSAVGPHLCDDCWLNDCPVQCYGKVLQDDGGAE